jgi:hypothetical protein
MGRLACPANPRTNRLRPAPQVLRVWHIQECMSSRFDTTGSNHESMSWKFEQQSSSCEFCSNWNLCVETYAHTRTMPNSNPCLESLAHTGMYGLTFWHNCKHSRIYVRKDCIQNLALESFASMQTNVLRVLHLQELCEIPMSWNVGTYRDVFGVWPNCKQSRIYVLRVCRNNIAGVIFAQTEIYVLSVLHIHKLRPTHIHVLKA